MYKYFLRPIRRVVYNSYNRAKLYSFVSVLSILINIFSPFIASWDYIVYAQESGAEEVTAPSESSDEAGEDEAESEESTEPSDTSDGSDDESKEESEENAPSDEAPPAESKEEPASAEENSQPAEPIVEPAEEETANEDTQTTEEVVEETEPVVEGQPEDILDTGASDFRPEAATEEQVWNVDEEKQTAETTEKIEKDYEYKFPLDEDVSVTFTKLPDESQRTTLKIVKVKVSDLDLPEGVNPASEYAYDITTGMEDGTFEYDLNLPKPENENVVVTYVEKEVEEIKKDGLDESEIIYIGEDAVSQEKKSGDLTVSGLDHFSVYFVTETPGTSISLEKFNNLSEWSVSGATATGSNSGEDSRYDGNFAKISDNGYICREVDATGYDNLKLRFVWKGDSDAENDDWGRIEYKTSGNCTSGGSWTAITSKRLNDTTWGSSTNNLVNSLDGTTFYIRFRNDSSNNDEYFRVDNFEVNGDVNQGNIEICHATSADNNPYVQQSPAKSGDVSGHAGHTGPVWYPGITESWGDIIPPFTYIGGSFPGLNWTTEGQAIWNAGCEVLGSITVSKEIDSDGDGTYDDLANTPGFTWGFASDDTPNTMGTRVTKPYGSYSIYESSIPGYHYTGWYTPVMTRGICGPGTDFECPVMYSCENPEGTDYPAPASIGGNDPVDASIVLCNARDMGEITFRKTVAGGDPTQWTFTVKDPTGATIGTYDHNQSAKLPTGEYLVEESGPEGYVFSWAEGMCSHLTGDAEKDADLPAFGPHNQPEVTLTVTQNGGYCDFINKKISDQCVEGSTWASGVDSHKQGPKKDGTTPITDPARIDPFKALGANDDVFYSLGYGGTIVVTFTGYVLDQPGSEDLSFHEVTWGRSGYGIEKALVDVSLDGSTWFSLGEITNEAGVGGTDGVAYKDLASSGLPWVKYVKLTDTTNDPSLPTDADGYDLDAVDAAYQVCEEPEYGKLQILKVDGETELPLGGASFSVCEGSSHSEGEFCPFVDVADGGPQDMDPLTEGSIMVGPLPVGEYHVHEIVIPTGYANDYPVVGDITVVKEQTTQVRVLNYPTTSTVLVCKYDDQKTPLPGWTVGLLGEQVDSFDVPSNGTLVGEVYPDDHYAVVATGVYNYGNAVMNADAANSFRYAGLPCSGATDGWVNGDAAACMNHYLSLNPSHSVGPTTAGWGTHFSSEHMYMKPLVGTNLDLKIWDSCSTSGEGCYGDNEGMLHVDVHKGYVGVTGDDGCVEFKDVARGTYRLDESLMDGWENVSGRGDVDVDEAKEVFNLVNKELPHNPQISIDKMGVDWAMKGDSVTFDYTITNTGDAPLSNVQVTDDKCSPVIYVEGDLNTNNVLEVTETWKYTCSTVPSWTFPNGNTNTATVTGEYNQQTVQFQDSFTLYPFTLRKDVKLKFGDTIQPYSDPNTKFTVEVGKGDNTLGDVVISESTPVNMWLSEGSYTFCEKDLPANYTPHYADGCINYTTGQGYPDWSQINYLTPMRIIGTKIICDNERDLPNQSSGMVIGVTTAADWLKSHRSCRLAPDWEFQWGYEGAGNPGDTFVGPATTPPWFTFGPTDVNGKTSVLVPVPGKGRVEVREVLQAEYLPFSYGPSGNNNKNDETAVMYCTSDAVNFDNWEWLNSPKAGSTYYCVAWNTPWYGSVGGIKFEDKNANGSRDMGEPTLRDWTIKLERFVDETWVPVETDTTDHSGRYGFGYLLAGEYRVSEVLKPTWAQTTQQDTGGYGYFKVSQGSESRIDFGNRRKDVTINAYKIVCDLEEDLPNWGISGGPGVITADTALDWVKSHRSCRLEEGWNFQWGYSNAPNPGDNTGESADPRWFSFGPTDVNGLATVKISDLKDSKHLWMREVWRTGYLGFTFGDKNDNSNNVSAEMYCHTDVLNYDNWDRIDGVAYDGTYYCVAWNVRTGELRGRKFIDTNADGHKQPWERFWGDADGGWEIKLYKDANDNGILETDADTYMGLSKTGDLGEHFYQFQSLVPGIYFLQEALSGAWVQTKPDLTEASNDYYKVKVNPGETKFRRFGNYQLGTIYGGKWLDVDKDGIWDEVSDCGDDARCFDEEGEKGLMDWTIELKQCAEPDGTDGELQEAVVLGLTPAEDMDLITNDEDFELRSMKFVQDISECELKTISTATTAEDGSYSFSGLKPGEYKVCEVMKPGYTNSTEVCRDILVSGDPAEKDNNIRIDFGNYVIRPLLTCAKFNDTGGAPKKPGQQVLFTLVIKAFDNFVDDVVVTDLFPKGFKYRLGSWTANSNLHGNLALGEPTYASPGDWNIGDMEPGEEVTLTYIADIESETDDGTYRDLAWAKGADVLAIEVLGEAEEGEENGYVDDNFVGTEVIVNSDPDTPYAEVDVRVTKVEEEGEVLGSSTYLPGTGADTNILAGLLIAVLLGIVLTVMGLRKSMRKANVLGMVLGVLAALTVTVSAQAASSLLVRLETPKSPQPGEFKLSFVTLDIVGGRDITVECMKKGPSDADFSVFQTYGISQGGNTETCDVDTSVLTEDGSYDFKVKASAGGDSSESDPVTVAFDGGGPGKPKYIKKDKKSDCKYEVKFKTADDGGETSYVEIYRSDDREFEANNSTRIETISIGSNETYEFADELAGGECAHKPYYAIRAFNSAGTPSNVRPEEIEETVTTSSSTSSESSTETGAQLAGGGSIAAGGIGGVGGEVEVVLPGEEGAGTGGETGEVAGAETSESTTEPGKTMMGTEDVGGTGTGGEEKKPNYWLWAIVLGGGAATAMFLRGKKATPKRGR